LLRSPRRAVWFHRASLLEGVASLLLYMTPTTMFILDAVVTGKELFVRSGTQRIILELTVICCLLLFRLPALVVAERCSRKTARSFEAGNPEARFHSMKLLLQSIWRMVCTASICMIIYVEGLLNAMLRPPCSVVGPGNDLASTCQTYVVAYSIQITGNLGFLLFSMAAMSLDLHLPGGLTRRAPKGLAREQIEKLRMHDFGDPTAPPTRPQCTICLGDFDPGDKVRYLPCGHHYHAQCVDAWLVQKAECPMRCHVDLRLLAAGGVIGALLDLEMQGNSSNSQGPPSRPA